MEFMPNIMIVDDTPANLGLLEKMLTSEGYNVFCFLRGDMAMRSISRKKPDMIFLDINMPYMNGFEMCSMLKSNRSTEDIPVIFISALTDTFDKVKAFNAGGIDYVTKPFELEEVRVRLKTHLRIHTLENELKEMNLKLEEKVEEQVKEIAESKYATISAIAKIAESRDHEIGNHIERVKAFCKILAEKLALESEYKDYITPKYIDNITHASLLHDIGKIGISDSILKKKGKLSYEEFEIMKKHTNIGAETLSDIIIQYPQNCFLKMGLSIARSHHEKWDGSGYPDGLKGDEIPLSARIMAVVDVYDALRSKRCYKEPFTHEYSLSIIEEGSGKHFDPQIAYAFIKFGDELSKLYEKIG